MIKSFSIYSYLTCDWMSVGWKQNCSPPFGRVRPYNETTELKHYRRKSYFSRLRVQALMSATRQEWDQRIYWGCLI